MQTIPSARTVATAVALLLACPPATLPPLGAAEKTEPAAETDLQVRPAPAPASLPEEIAISVGRFFGFLQRANVDGAYDSLLKGTKIAENTKDSSLLKDKTRAALDMFGKIDGYELLAFRYAGSALLHADYLSLGANYPLRWRFYFYRSANPDVRWRLIDIRVDDRLAATFSPDSASSQDASEPAGPVGAPRPPGTPPAP